LAAHEFEKARFYSEKSARKRNAGRPLRDRYKLTTHYRVVTREDIEEVVSAGPALQSPP